MNRDAEFYYHRGLENNGLNRCVEAVDDYSMAIELDAEAGLKANIL